MAPKWPVIGVRISPGRFLTGSGGEEKTEEEAREDRLRKSAKSTAYGSKNRPPGSLQKSGKCVSCVDVAQKVDFYLKSQIVIFRKSAFRALTSHKKRRPGTCLTIEREARFMRLSWANLWDKAGESIHPEKTCHRNWTQQNTAGHRITEQNKAEHTRAQQNTASTTLVSQSLHLGLRATTRNEQEPQWEH